MHVGTKALCRLQPSRKAYYNFSAEWQPSLVLSSSICHISAISSLVNHPRLWSSSMDDWKTLQEF